MLYIAFPNNCFSEGNYYFRVENVMSGLDPLFLRIKSWCGSTLHIYKVSDVVSATKRFALKIKLKF